MAWTTLVVAAVSESTITGWLRPEFRISPQ
jgi:hypothetical protein